MAEYNVALLDAFYGRVRLDHVHAAANHAETAVALSKAQFPDESFAGGSTIDSEVVNQVSGKNVVTGAVLSPQRLPALPTTLHQP